MRIYRYEKRMLVQVQPGSVVKDGPSDWFDAATKEPIMFSVQFEDHTAKVDARLGRYMVDQGLAYKTLQETAAAGIIVTSNMPTGASA